jgi:murein DD-endopeptidase MepM/ murein hydrolase activator NlpD
VTIDPTYRFGSTQDGEREPHHGVEFPNGLGVPVVAAAAGTVEFAGADHTQLFGPYMDFYGNVVVIRHELSDEARQELNGFSGPVFSLYGHLSQVLVKTGDTVGAGKLIGKVGATGIAGGTHLHFEVRLGGDAYADSRNPEIWLKPLAPTFSGGLAGQALDAQGKPGKISEATIRRTDGPGGRPLDAAIPMVLYEEKDLLGRPPYNESFGIGDLPAGWYRISYVWNSLQFRDVQVFPGRLTVVSLKPGN